MTTQICPKCGGELNIKNASGKVFCYHCGEEVSGILATTRADDEEKLLSLGRTSEEAGSHKEAIEFYNKVLEINPVNYEAWLGKGKSIYFESTLANPRLGEMVKFFERAYETAPDERKEKVAEEVKAATLAYVTSFFQWAKSHYQEFNDTSGAFNSFFYHCDLILNTIEAIIKIPCSIPELLDVALYVKGIEVLDNTSVFKSDYKLSKRNEFTGKILKLDPNHKFPEPPKLCFIATATLGDYDHPDVKILRQFRDNKLMPRKLGRIFVNFYYKNSPPLADLIRQSNFLKTMVRALLIKPLVFLVKHIRNDA